MSTKTALLIFEVDDLRCALPIENVVKVESAVEIAQLPAAPDVVAGVVNVHGKLLPVMDVRKRLKLPPQEMKLRDHLILARTEARELVLWVGEVTGVEEHVPAPQEDFHDILKSLPHLSGISPLGDSLILIHDLERFLSDGEEKQLIQAMDRACQ